jgi:pimeloyl-ACP methyl ester carboxylesterase
VRSLLLDRTPHDAYRALAMPALFMMGERSPMPARRVCEVLARTLPDASLVTVEGAGHMAPLTHGPIVGDLLAEHFRKAESKTSA